jgi:murein DD-endopeptidase MepM/ murein hydrolase activator NlpD
MPRFPKQNIVLGTATASLKASPGEMETVSALRKTVSEQRHWDEPFAAPVPGCLTSPFGVQRLYNGKPSGNYHAGVDQRAPEGTPIVAAAGGTVKIARMFNVHGGTVGIDHGQGLTSTYLHMSKIAATEGSAVKKGDAIGYVGTTGRSTAPHLHWGIAVNGVHVNPTQWVPLKPCTPARKPAGRRRR